MQDKFRKLTAPALALAAAIGAFTPAYAGGGNMNPAGSNPQPDPQQSGQSSTGTGEASRASSADTKQEKMELPGSDNSRGDKTNEGSAKDKKSQ